MFCVCWDRIFLFPSQITIADIVFFRAIEKSLVFLPKPLDDHPRLKAVYTLVENNERIADWILRRPETPW